MASCFVGVSGLVLGILLRILVPVLAFVAVLAAASPGIVVLARFVALNSSLCLPVLSFLWLFLVVVPLACLFSSLSALIFLGRLVLLLIGRRGALLRIFLLSCQVFVILRSGIFAVLPPALLETLLIFGVLLLALVSPCAALNRTHHPSNHSSFSVFAVFWLHVLKTFLLIQ